LYRLQQQHWVLRGGYSSYIAEGPWARPARMLGGLEEHKCYGVDIKITETCY
jgi:hypothetical protein